MSKRWPTSRDRAEREILPLNLSLYHAARDYPGGGKAIAAIYGVPATTLQHRLNPNADTHKLTVDDLEYVLEASRDTRILDSLLALVPGAHWFEYDEESSECSEQQLMESVAKLSTQVGNLLTRISEHRRDGVYHEHEVAELKKLKYQLFGSIKALVVVAQQFEGEVRHG
ncbi:phage regulatory CII family protein [Vreelandella glaciei]|uniref:phage regulatory CII family protein n=1 Tax=Vreelandella glaciei TaxID=186761 RepID=UPI0030EC25F5|tara:strand:- start:24507 stop:25016 length:510 start_codon:yes stop_codon:yes gene_type:complete